MKPFAFELEASVRLILSKESGFIIGRAQYSDSPPQYLVRYLTADQRQVENWQDETAIEAAN